jgi:hypothetical protein
VDLSNIVSTKRQQLPQASSAIDQQPEFVNLVQPVTMVDAMASSKEKYKGVNLTKRNTSCEPVTGTRRVLDSHLGEERERSRYPARFTARLST